ncbi:hypothetical protein GCM10028804_32590 [Larkinella terrae]
MKILKSSHNKYIKKLIVKNPQTAEPFCKFFVILLHNRNNSFIIVPLFGNHINGNTRLYTDILPHNAISVQVRKDPTLLLAYAVSIRSCGSFLSEFQ